MDIKKNNIYCKRNIGMMMDLYELTMANGYFKQENAQKKVAFDVFFRRNPDQGGFSVFAGLEQIVEYIEGLHFSDDDIEYLRSLHLFTEDFLEYLRNFKFTGDVYAFREGTIMYPNEPIITVVADLIQAQIVETEILAQINHQSLIATKARRIVKAANGRPVSDFGARRAHNNDAAIYGARAAFIGGANGTATVSAGQYFDIPIGGTMAHSWVMYYEDELTAFRKFAEIYPDNCILLVDTYDVVKSGIPNAIKIFDEMKANNIQSKNFGIRIDSGDLAYLTKVARKMLDKAGYKDAKIVISNSLDEYTITSILSQGGQVDSFGVGERMITSKSEPVFGAVYKLCAVENEGKMEPRIKISEAIEKITNPGLKEVYRIYNEDGQAIADLLAHKDEEVNMENVYRFIDPEKPWKKREFVNCTAKKLQRLVIKEGKRVIEPEKVTDIAAFVKKQLETEIWEEEQRFENPHKHYLDMTKSYYEMKMNMLDK
ncbi:nicotinate phosphoribosyltransferase [Lachnobacterium bovis]|jgi:nicotinate phosphoribosyltransferase|uniref:Nicotinate phosphoribosyltransferase n=1 Tax=Lachnobacterium bovis DSM 14045 TaxID=1122142 RepID=A0A1H3J3A9_9FIRM|nr:nicotinate phosphoribosyltransferase [Lachnobacterium bovis]MBQ1802829.1 nicotinate phosphoribosyltransferase [Lachnobacterium sp.]SDY34416.1 nicotinate phosphoribosyltransferase [Lachnobacterium bovis DSM 14045]